MRATVPKVLKARRMALLWATAAGLPMRAVNERTTIARLAIRFMTDPHLELDHDTRADDGLAQAQVRLPQAAVGAAVGARGAVVAHEASRRSIHVAARGARAARQRARRRDAAGSRPARNTRMTIGGFRPPRDPILGHVLKIELRVPLIELESRVLTEIRRPGRGGRAIDGWDQREVAPGIAVRAAAPGDRVLVMAPPGTVINIAPIKDS